MIKKFTDKHKIRIAFGIGVAYVLLGVTQALFKNDFFNQYQVYIDKFYYWGFIIAAMLIFSCHRKKAEPAEEAKQPEENNPVEEKKE